MKGYLIAIIFIVGLALGIVGMIYGPDILEPYMPSTGAFSMSKGQPVEGRVVAKLPRADKLLITVSTPEGASLVTFNQKVDEISLLVDEGDYITLKMGKYEPFVMNPAIVRVRKKSPEFGGGSPAMTSPVPAPSEPAMRDTAPMNQDKEEKGGTKTVPEKDVPPMKDGAQEEKRPGQTT